MTRSSQGVKPSIYKIRPGNMSVYKNFLLVDCRAAVGGNVLPLTLYYSCLALFLIMPFWHFHRNIFFFPCWVTREAKQQNKEHVSIFHPSVIHHCIVSSTIAHHIPLLSQCHPSFYLIKDSCPPQLSFIPHCTKKSASIFADVSFVFFQPWIWQSTTFSG